MTTQELDALAPGTRIYLPTEWEVLPWDFAARVPERNWYTVFHPPDKDGVIWNRRPIYFDAVQLQAATLDEADAWKAVLVGLEERKEWINRKLKTLT